MRIVFDAYELVFGRGKSLGIYNYAKNLFQALAAAIDDETEILVICNGLNVYDFSCADGRVSNIVVSKGMPGKFSRLAWMHGRAAWISKDLNADVYFSPKGFLPRGIKFFSPGTKTAVVIHDLIPLWYAEHFPGYFGQLEELYINHSLVASAKLADSVIAISRATADDIARRTGRAGGVTIVHNGVPMTEPGPRPLASPYIFAVTSQLPHKNATGLLAAYGSYRAYADSPLPLVICGVADVNQAGVTVLHTLDSASIHTYYAYASLFVFLSFIEGFGFPPVEALAHGVPVICSDIPSLREIADGLISFVPPAEPETAGKKMAEILARDDPESAKTARRNIVTAYTWEACAKGVLAAMRD